MKFKEVKVDQFFTIDLRKEKRGYNMSLLKVSDSKAKDGSNNFHIIGPEVHVLLVGEQMHEDGTLDQIIDQISDDHEPTVEFSITPPKNPSFTDRIGLTKKLLVLKLDRLEPALVISLGINLFVLYQLLIGNYRVVLYYFEIYIFILTISLILLAIWKRK